jgi:hypothetical protein
MNHKEVLAEEICEIYKGQKEEDFWLLVKQTGFKISRIIGNNFAVKVDSFLDRCIFHEPDETVLDVFDLLCEDVPEDWAIYSVCQLIKDKTSGKQ